MADIFTPEKRSQVMSRIRSRNTKPELAVRSMLHRLGYRFTVNGQKNRSLPGRPDIVLPKYRTVIFVHGCFWHGHEHCPKFRMRSPTAHFGKRKLKVTELAMLPTKRSSANWDGMWCRCGSAVSLLSDLVHH